MKKIKHFLAFFITVTMIVSGGGLDGFAALSYATENQDEPAVTQEQDTESVEQEEAEAPDQGIVSEDQIEPEESEEPEEPATGVKDSDESEDPAEPEYDENAFTELSASIKTSDDSKWKVTAIVPDGAGIPENAELIIEETAEQDYEGYLEESAKALKWESTDRAGYARFLNISFKSKGKTIEPSKKVEFTIASEDVKKNIDTMQVVCFGDDQSKDKEKAEELICEVTENDELIFRTDRMGAFGFVTLDEISLTKKTLKKGNVTLKGMMPEDAKLQTSDEMKAKAVKALEKKKEDTALAAYDITISSEGEEYQPDADHPIQVKIANEAIKKDSNLSVWHLKDDGTKEEVKDFTTADGAVSFEADGFSVYVIIEHEGEEEVVTPRVEFHYIDPNFTEIQNDDSTFSYKASPYEFPNKNNEKQVTQILKDGEGLEKITNPPNKRDDGGAEKSFFYGWYTVDMSSDTTAYSDGEWTGKITYTWPEPQKVNEETNLEITSEGTLAVGEEIAWSIGDASGTAVLDSEGTAHVYLAPLYEHYQFVYFHMGSKEADAGLRNNLLTRRVLVFGQNESVTTRIGDVVSPSPDPAHQVFVGWETIKKVGATYETNVFYQTLDGENNERNVIAAVDGTETLTDSGGYRITVKKTDSGFTSVDLFPVYAEARWLHYDLGNSGNGAIYVPAVYRLTNDDGKGTCFTKLATTKRPGYELRGWWTDKDCREIQLTDGNGEFLAAVRGKTFYGVYTTDETGARTLTSISTTQTAGAVKIFEITTDGEMYFYKDIDSLTVHAEWVAETVDYTVVYWLENADDSEYSLMYYKVLQGNSGAQTQAQESQPSDTFVREGITYHPYEEYKLQFAHLSTDQDKSKDGDQAGIQQQEIQGNGSTIVNVYYDRNLYTLRFDVGFSQGRNYYVSNVTNSSNGNNDNYNSFLTNQQVNIGTTNPFTSGNFYTGSYTSGNSTVYYYDITAKYGQTIVNKWPDTLPNYNGTKGGGNNQLWYFIGWIASDQSYYWRETPAASRSSIKGAYVTMSEDIMGVWDGSKYVYVTAENGVTHELHCRYNSSTRRFQYRQYFWDPETETYPETYNSLVVTGGTGSTPAKQTATHFVGYELEKKTNLTANGTVQDPAVDSYSDYNIPEIGNRGMIVNFYYKPNLHHVSYKYGAGSPPDLINTEFSIATKPYYYDQSLSTANVNQDAAEEATPRGFHFVGWFDNPDGVGNAFDFNSSKMPDGDIVLYAVYQPLEYTIKIDPNGAEIDHIDHTGGSYSDLSGVTPLNRPQITYVDDHGVTIVERPADSGYNKNQSTYFFGDYGETVGEYTVGRSYVPIGDKAAEIYMEGGRSVYAYVNIQYKAGNIDGKWGVPYDLRDALYVDVTDGYGRYKNDDESQGETELYTLYKFYHNYINAEFDIDPDYWDCYGARDISYEAWIDTFVNQNSEGTPQYYRKCNSKENWVFLGWFKDGASMPYDFSDPVEGPFTLTAHWRLDGGYTIQYIPEYWLESETGDPALINGEMDDWVDPVSDAEELSYTDGASTTVFKAPTGLTKNGTEVTDGSLVFRGWRIVSVSTTTDSSGHTITTYTPLEEDKYYDPGDDFNVDVQYADSNNVIHMQAVYEETEGSVRRPEVANLTLDANSGYLVDKNGNELTADTNLDWDGAGTTLMDASADQIQFGDVQSSKAVHLYEYATKDAETGLSGGTNYFKHPDGHFLLGFDPQNDPDKIVALDKQDDSQTGGAQPYVPNYSADSVITVQRTDNKKLYAIWEPMVYMTFVNDTDANDKAVGPVTFGLSPVSDADAEALTVVNVKEGTYSRKPLTDYSSITLQPGESITLAFPKGAEKSIKVTGTNDQLGAGSILYWQGALEGETEGHASGNCNNGKNFEFQETLVVNKEGIVVTFTSDQHERTLVFDDNYPGGGTQEQYFTDEEFNERTASATMPSTNTRFGYVLKGWAKTSERANNGIVDYATGYVLEGDEMVDFFGEDYVKTLYAVWDARTIANTVFVYKTVPAPGSQSQEFTYDLNIHGTFQNNNAGRTETLDKSGEFTLSSGQHAKIVMKESVQDRNAKSYLQATVYVYDVNVDDEQEGAVPLSTTIFKAEASRNGQGTFNGSERFYVNEENCDNYTPSIEVASSTQTGTTNDLEASDSKKVTWKKPSAGGTVIYTNTLDTHDITVDKTTHVGSSTVTTQFAFKAKYTLDNVETDLGTFYVTSGTPNTTSLKDIPAGAVLTIEEIDAEKNYNTTVKLDSGTAQTAKTTTFTVSKDHTVYFVNRLKSYDVKFIKTDQDDTAGVVEAKFNLDASTYSIGTDLLASDSPGSDGVFYSDETTGYEPLYAGNKYTLTETYTESGYIGLKTPVTITVSGTDDNTFTFTDPNGKKVKDVSATLINGVWNIKVKNQETKSITIRKTFDDPLYNQRTFKFRYSYKFGDDPEVSDAFTKTVPTGSTVSEIITVPVGAKNLTVTELTTDSGDDHYAWVSTQYDTTVMKTGDTKPASGSSCQIDEVTQNATISFTNTRKTVDVIVKKTVEGAGGDFTFTALLQNTSDAPMKGYTLYDDGTTSIVTSNVDETAGQATFTLSPADNETASQVLTVPYGAHLTVTEKGKDGYDTTVQVDGGTAAASLTTGKLTITVPTTITFTNSEVIVAPTGYVSRQMPYICIGLLALLLLAVMAFGRRRRNWAAED